MTDGDFRPSLSCRFYPWDCLAIRGNKIRALQGQTEGTEFRAFRLRRTVSSVNPPEADSISLVAAEGRAGSFVVFVVPYSSLDKKRGTTKEAKDTKTIQRKKGHPQISQISTDQFNLLVKPICENLSNLWTNPFVISSASGSSAPGGPMENACGAEAMIQAYRLDRALAARRPRHHFCLGSESR
jgi:hypothetical protein